MIIRFYTEDKNSEFVRELVGKSFPQFTMFHAVGVWKGHKESSLVIEVVTENYFDDENVQKAVPLAQAIKDMNKQENVLVVYSNAFSRLI